MSTKLLKNKIRAGRPKHPRTHLDKVVSRADAHGLYHGPPPHGGVVLLPDQINAVQKRSFFFLLYFYSFPVIPLRGPGMYIPCPLPDVKPPTDRTVSSTVADVFFCPVDTLITRCYARVVVRYNLRYVQNEGF